MNANGKPSDSNFLLAGNVLLASKAEKSICVMGLSDPTHFILKEYQG
jgi:hypothetical protein